MSAPPPPSIVVVLGIMAIYQSFWGLFARAPCCLVCLRCLCPSQALAAAMMQQQQSARDAESAGVQPQVPSVSCPSEARCEPQKQEAQRDRDSIDSLLEYDLKQLTRLAKAAKQAHHSHDYLTLASLSEKWTQVCAPPSPPVQFENALAPLGLNVPPPPHLVHCPAPASASASGGWRCVHPIL